MIDHINFLLSSLSLFLAFTPNVTVTQPSRGGGQESSQARPYKVETQERGHVSEFGQQEEVESELCLPWWWWDRMEGNAKTVPEFCLCFGAGDLAV